MGRPRSGPGSWSRVATWRHLPSRRPRHTLPAITRARSHQPARADFRARVEETVARLKPGEVCSYGDIAADAGSPGAARAVGAVLASSHGLPWWRVTYADGRLASGHEADQARRLAAEGVPLEGQRVRMPAARDEVTGRERDTAARTGRHRHVRAAEP
ncbi:MAG: MGMT family protein [Actinomycetota bacterium]|nr:MGMT family protein [Actinomycetota bacterium]